MKSKKVKNELNSLFSGELFCIIMFPAIYFMRDNSSILKFNVATFSIVIGLSIILLEGVFYWKYTLKKINRKKVMNKWKVGRLYNIFKMFNLFMLVLIAILIIFFSSVTERYEMLFQVLLYVFLILEYINYFHVRLSFYTRSKIFLQIIKPIKILFNRTEKPSKIANDIKYFKQNKED
ncbi:hypothetical protein RAK27_01270 [Carnobacterium maltaromaticum]|uniref:General stress protein n=1 Tax=Carnobacterium maltaromaticum TaxID=2751 RepID=A0AAW9JNW5_CARML|nr:hypothetical protein [Carnobacterium maltaromaticum]MDZ5757283.1 hypothetical protein [Carnobacterium maltaromaticum]